MARIYVGGLAQSTTERELQEFFGRRLPIKRIAINSKHARVFDGVKNITIFAFLEFDCEEAQLEKVLAYNKCFWNGSYLRVQQARKPPYVYVPRESAATDKRLVDAPRCDHRSAQKERDCSTEMETKIPGHTVPPESAPAPAPINTRKRRVRILNTVRPKTCS